MDVGDHDLHLECDVPHVVRGVNDVVVDVELDGVEVATTTKTARNPQTGHVHDDVIGTVWSCEGLEFSV